MFVIDRRCIFMLLLNGIFVVQRIQPFQVVSFELAFNSSDSKLRMELATVNLTNSRNWSRISVDNSAASLLPGLWVGPMFSPCSDLLDEESCGR
jgi:hypothetical protein